MLCESCGVFPATTHVKTIINGELSEYCLCAQCAQKLGYGNLTTGLGLSVGSLLGGFFSHMERPEADVVRCKFCGSTFDDIARSGKVGCAECYHTFYNRLIPLIQQIHGNAKHRGKVPGGSQLSVNPQTQLSVMRSELRRAIDSENFEHAAELRDRIRALEGEGQNGKMV
ncbi:UvrB/UvrC motif-containing protein [Caproiciproducens sp. LBM24188]